MDYVTQDDGSIAESLGWWEQRLRKYVEPLGPKVATVIQTPVAEGLRRLLDIGGGFVELEYTDATVTCAYVRAHLKTALATVAMQCGTAEYWPTWELMVCREVLDLLLNSDNNSEDPNRDKNRVLDTQILFILAPVSQTSPKVQKVIQELISNRSANGLITVLCSPSSGDWFAGEDFHQPLLDLLVAVSPHIIQVDYNLDQIRNLNGASFPR